MGEVFNLYQNHSPDAYHAPNGWFLGLNYVLKKLVTDPQHHICFLIEESTYSSVLLFIYLRNLKRYICEKFNNVPWGKAGLTGRWKITNLMGKQWLDAT